MTQSEKIRVIIVIILFLAYLVKRFDLIGKVRESRQKKQEEEAKQRLLEERKERRKQHKEQLEVQKTQTAEILKRGLVNLQQKSVKAGGQEIWYLEGGMRDAPAVLLLHGFAGIKEDWSEVGKALIGEGFHVVAPDLPGFGQNKVYPDLAHDVTSQTKRVRAFVQKAGLSSFHLAGHSMGGSIAAAIAYAAPTDVHSLVLIEPFGVGVPYKSELDNLLEQERNPMVIATPAAYDNLLSFTFHEPPEIAADLKKLRAEQAAKNRAFYLKVWTENRDGERSNLLDLLLPVIKIRALVIMGAQSQVVHPATSGIIEAMMPDSKSTLIDSCGHFPMVEKPRETAAQMLRFLRSIRAPASGEPAGS